MSVPTCRVAAVGMTLALLSVILSTSLTSADLVHIPLQRRDVPSHRLFSHARRPWFIQLHEARNQPLVPAATNASSLLGQQRELQSDSQLLNPPHTPLRYIDLAHPARAPAPTSSPAGSSLPEHKMRGNMSPIGEYYLILTFADQPIHVQIDTGSATTAVPLSACKSCRPDDRRLDPSLGDSYLIKCSSSLCQDHTCSAMCPSCSRSGACCSRHLNDACYFRLKYADGSGVEGALYQAPVGVAGLTVPLAFGAILDASPDFEREDVDGIVGFSYKQLGCNPTCVLPLFDSLIAAKKVDEEIFSLCTSDHGGTLTLGGSNPKLYNGKLQYVPIFHTRVPMFYRVRVSGMIVNDRNPKLPAFSVGIVDSGTTLLIITRTAYLALRAHFFQHYCAVPGLCVGRAADYYVRSPDIVSAAAAGSAAARQKQQSDSFEGLAGIAANSSSSTKSRGTPFIVRQEDDAPTVHAQSWFTPGYCVNLNDETVAKLPTITIKLEGVDLELTPDDYMLRHKVTNAFGTAMYRCLGIAALEGLEHMPNNIIIGNTVLRKYYVEYDRKNSRLGFATAKNCYDPNAKEPNDNYTPPWTRRIPQWIRRSVPILILVAIIALVVYCLQAVSQGSGSSGYQPIEGR